MIGNSTGQREFVDVVIDTGFDGLLSLPSEKIIRLGLPGRTSNIMPHLLRTERLSLRPCQMSDLDAIHQLWTEADVRRFLFDDRQITNEEAKSFIEASVVSFASHGYGIWLFFEHQNDQVAGFSGLLHSLQISPSLIFGARPQLWGRGYAKEATLSVLRYAFDVLGLEKIEADVDEPNQASIRVLEALGMSRTRREIVNEHPLLYYEIQTWRS